jgi:hypothetical protein
MTEKLSWLLNTLCYYIRWFVIMKTADCYQLNHRCMVLPMDRLNLSLAPKLSCFVLFTDTTEVQGTVDH